ncbi:J domain-containing protein [Treponema sp.]|uniref:J domain-containing protein n=1 Tax=Treponema sp. TaxID=166 RepID=UPI00298DC7A4|nr:J domain-containing protein [Treponema sp.]MCR5613639.1 J domain-containing protein [Treponema sp.]
MENYYKILGVKQNASLSEIRRAYRQKVKILHPDKTGTHDTSEEFARVVQAYKILSDQKSRSLFDSSLFAHVKFSRKSDNSFDYRKWLLAREDQESRAKLIFFDLMHDREDDAVAEFKRMNMNHADFSLKHWFTREDFMDYGFILSEELVLRGEYYDAFLLLEQIIRMEYSYNYFRLFFPEVIAFTKNILRTKLDGVINDELALDALERALDLNLGAKDDAFFLQLMSQIYKRMGDETTALICLEESQKILKNA